MKNLIFMLMTAAIMASPILSGTAIAGLPMAEHIQLRKSTIHQKQTVEISRLVKQLGDLVTYKPLILEDRSSVFKEWDLIINKTKQQKSR